MRLCHGPVSRADTVCGEELQERAQAEVDGHQPCLEKRAWSPVEDMGGAGLGNPGQDGGFIGDHKEICDQEFWVLPVWPPN